MQNSSPSTYFDAAAQSRRDDLLRRLRRLGAVSVARLMAEALLAPSGEYGSHRSPIGRAGDFTTSPEVSQMFGEMIGAWLVAAWHMAGGPENFSLMELGPGRGTLLCDALRVARRDAHFCHAASIVLIETSPALRHIQAENLARLGWSDVVWHTDLVSALDRLAGPVFLIANEFLDALPAYQFQYIDGVWRERLISLHGSDDMRFVLGDPVPIPVPSDCHPPSGAIYEHRPAIATIATSLGPILLRYGGTALFIDYGYRRCDTAARWQSTLRGCVSHHSLDPLQAAGIGDLSVDVDFTALADIFIESGNTVLGPLAQQEFLLEIGLAHRLIGLQSGKSDRVTARLQREYQRLLDPAGLGSFLVLGVAGKGIGRLPGLPVG